MWLEVVIVGVSKSGEADTGKVWMPSWENIELDKLRNPYFYRTHKTHKTHRQTLLSKAQRPW